MGKGLMKVNQASQEKQRPKVAYNIPQWAHMAPKYELDLLKSDERKITSVQDCVCMPTG